MMRRMICVLMALAGVIWLGVPVSAAETGSIRVTLDNGDTVVPDGAVTLYYAGSPLGYDYRLTEDFGGGMIKGEDALSPALASWLAEMAVGGGMMRVLDEDGSGEFCDLTEGLYLLVQTEGSTGYHIMEPMLVQLPCQGQWHVQAYPKIEEIIYQIAVEPPATGQSPAPFLGVVGMVLSGTGLVICGRKRRKA